MFQFSAVLTLILAFPADDPTLEASISSGGTREFGFTSTVSAAADGRPVHAITETLANHLTDVSIYYALGPGVRGVVGKAESKAGRTIPKMVTMVRTSSRRIHEVDGELAGRSPDGRKDFIISPAVWAERDEKFRAGDGAKLEAKLIDGDANGRVLVRCGSEVTRVADKRYRYSYVVENKSDRPLKFKWGDYEGSLKPKESFTKTAESGESTFEESATLSVTFDGDTDPTELRTNRWTPPK